MKISQINILRILFATVVLLMATSPVWLFPVLNTTETTGVCIYKGPAFYGGFFGSSSQGVPLRGIVVTAYDNQRTLSVGTTDRTGCFYFTANHNWNGFVSYSYNGTKYIDNIQAGVVLGDNLP